MATMVDDIWGSSSSGNAPNAIADWIDAELKKNLGAAASDLLLDAVRDAQSDPRECIRIDAVLKKYGVYRAVYHAIDAQKRSIRPQSTKPQIEVTTEERKVASQAIDVLSRRQDFYQRGGILVQIVTGQEMIDGVATRKSVSKIQQMPMSQVRSRLADSICWLKPNRHGELYICHPPEWLARDIVDRGEWFGVRHLLALTECPIMRPDGSILEKAGYDLASCIEYRPNADYPAIGDPTRDDAQAAISALKEIVCDFPLKGPAHAAAWLASLLTPLARNAFPGPAPLCLLDANVRGSGKSLLADVISQIVVGRQMARMSQSKDEEEDRKRITAIAIQGDPLVLIDNLTRTFGNGAIDAALTSCEWQERILGSNNRPVLPLRACWYATGNNISVKGDTGRRCLHIRLESTLENPEDRSGFLHPNLLQWVHENRPYFVICALRILRAYHLAGRPSVGLDSWGSFQGWSDLVRSSIVWAGCEDPCETRVEFRELADTDAAHLPALLQGIRELASQSGQMIDVGLKGITARSITLALEKNEGNEALRESLSVLVPRLTSASLGAKLRSVRGRIIGGITLNSVRKKNISYWCVLEKK
jgi:hypothetical protein